MENIVFLWWKGKERGIMRRWGRKITVTAWWTPIYWFWTWPILLILWRFSSRPPNWACPWALPLWFSGIGWFPSGGRRSTSALLPSARNCHPRGGCWLFCWCEESPGLMESLHFPCISWSCWHKTNAALHSLSCPYAAPLKWLIHSISLAPSALFGFSANLCSYGCWWLPWVLGSRCWWSFCWRICSELWGFYVYFDESLHVFLLWFYGVL